MDYIIKETNDYYPLSVLFDELGMKIPVSETAPEGTVKMWRLEDAKTGELRATTTLQIRDNVHVLGQLAVKEEYQKQGYGRILQDIVFDEARKMGLTELWGNAKIPEYYHPFGWETMEWDNSPRIAETCHNCEKRGKECFPEILRKVL